MTILRKTTWGILLGLFGLGLPAGTRADHPQAQGPLKMDAAFMWRCNIKVGYAQYHLGPWYSYFPYDAHFQMQAPFGGSGTWPTQTPFYPGQHLPGQQPHMPPANQRLPQQNTSLTPVGGTSMVQPFGNYGPAPSYWYSNR